METPTVQTLPSYDPPSYDSVVRDVLAINNGQVTDHSAAQILTEKIDAIQQNVLAEHASRLLADGKLPSPELTPEEKAEASKQVAEFASSPEGQALFKEAALAASSAIKKIDDAFVELYGKLLSADDKFPAQNGQKKLSEQFQEHRKTFNAIVRESRTQARQIADYAELFEEALIPMLKKSKETKETKEEREKKAAFAQTFIDDAKRYSEESVAIQTKLKGFVDEFQRFVQSFKTWYTTQNNVMNNELATLKAERDKLYNEMQDLGKWATGLFAATGVAILGTCLVALACPLLLPAILVGGFAISGAIGLTALGVNYARMNKETAYNDKGKQIDALIKKQDDLAQTEQLLTELGNKDVLILRDSIGGLCKLWDKVYFQAVSVQTWMKKDKEAIEKEMDDFTIKVLTNKSVKIYSTIAVYMNAYIDGLTEISETS